MMSARCRRITARSGPTSMATATRISPYRLSAGGMHSLLRNLLPPADARRSISVRVVDGRKRATRAGAEVRAFAAGNRRLIGMRLVDTGSGYDAQNDMPVHITLPSLAAIDLEVTFPAGARRLTVRPRDIDPTKWHGRTLVVPVK